MGCRRFFVGVVGRTSDSRSSDLSSRAAPRCLFCAWVSDLRFKCLFSTFLSTSLDDFEALGANFSALGAILEALGAHLGGSGGGLGGLGAPFGGSGAVLEPSWAVLERSWRPSCGNVIFGRFLRRFWGRLGRPRGSQMEPKLEPKRTKIEDEKADATSRPSRSSWGRLGAILGPSWPNLRPSWGDLRAAAGCKIVVFP